MSELVQRRPARSWQKGVGWKMASSTGVSPRRRGGRTRFQLRMSDASWARVWIVVLLLVLAVLIAGFFVSSASVSPEQLLPR